MCGCNKTAQASANKNATTCGKCKGYKTAKKGTIVCPICKNVFYAK